jgi:hypothetical protein
MASAREAVYNWLTRHTGACGTVQPTKNERLACTFDNLIGHES